MGKSADKPREAGQPLSNPRHERFCELYATERDFMGNGTECYLEAFEISTKSPTYKAARSLACRLLTNVNIVERINEMLTDEGFNDENVTKQHLFLINQDADLGTKKGSVEMYYKLKGKLAEKHEHSGVLQVKQLEADIKTIAHGEQDSSTSEEVVQGRTGEALGTDGGPVRDILSDIQEAISEDSLDGPY